MALNEIRSNWFWIVNANAVVARYIYRCVSCRKHRGKLQTQKCLIYLPNRVELAPPLLGPGHIGSFYLPFFQTSGKQAFMMLLVVTLEAFWT